MPLLFFHSSSNPLLSFFNNQMMCGCGSVGCDTMCKRRGWRVLWNGQKAGGLSLRVKRDERVGVWWLDGVDVSDGFVSNTLSLSMSSHINPSLNGQPQSSVFQSRCVVATSISVLVLLCCPTFALCPIPFSLIIGISLLRAP